MNEAMIEQIVEAVLREMNASGCDVMQEGLPKMLVIGDMCDVPAKLSQDVNCFGIEDYIQNKNIHRYDKVLITKLTMTQLSDIALARDASPESCAVVNALLAGLDVCMLEKALLHRKYSGKSSSRLYQTLENNVKLIQTFGVKLLKEQAIAPVIPAKPAKYQAPKIQAPAGNAIRNTDQLITEAVAQKIAECSKDVAYISKDAIVTPSAWDIFKQKGLQVVRQ